MLKSDRVLVSSRAVLVSILLTVGVPTATLASAPALQPAAQNPDMVERLRRENEALKQRIVSLEQKLRELQAQLDGMQGGGGAAPVKDAPKLTADIPADPLASLESMLAALQSRYRADMAEFGGEGAKPDAATEQKHKSAVARWVADQKKALSGKSQWLVRIVRTDSQTGRQTGVSELETSVQIIEPTSGLPIGEQFRLKVPSRFLRVVQNAKPDELYTLSGTFAASPKFNAQRESEGAFNVPPLIGKYAEFDYTFVWERVEKAEEKK